MKINAEFELAILRDHLGGKLTAKSAAAKLGCSVRTVKRRSARLSAGGPSALQRKKSDRTPEWKTDRATEERIVELYRTRYEGFNYTHFLEKLREDEGIRVTYPVLWRILGGAGIRSPQAQRPGKAGKELHPRRDRRRRTGELIQVDATPFEWFGRDKGYWTMHGAVDDATGEILSLWIEKEETLHGYYMILRQILLERGIPQEWYSDGRTVFIYRSKALEEGAEGRGTQFQGWCRDLGIEMHATPVPQAKGRIERLWKTLQGRLSGEFRLMGITDAEGANRFLDEYRKAYNSEFAVKPASEESAFVPLGMDEEGLDRLLSVRSERMAGKGSEFSFKGKKVQLVKDDGTVLPVGPGEVVELRVTWSGEIWGYRNRKYYRTKAVDGVPSSPSTKIVQEQRNTSPKERKEHKTSKDNPWRHFKI